MHAALALAALLAAPAPAAGRAAPQAVELSRLLLPQSNWDQMVAAQKAQVQQGLGTVFRQSAEKFGRALPPSFAEVIQAETETLFAKLLPTYQEMVDFQAGVLQKHYAPEELKQLLAFHRSPLGQKMVRVQPEVFRDSTAWSQSRLQQQLPALLQGLKARMAEALEAGDDGEARAAAEEGAKGEAPPAAPK